MQRFSTSLWFIGAVLAFAVLWTGCDSGDDSDSDSTPTVQTFAGTMAGGSESGSLTLTIDGTEVTGSFSLIGVTRSSSFPPTDLTGTYNPNTGTVSMSGGGFSFTGTISGNTFSGTYINPDGSTGTFTTYLDGSDADEVRVYCGTYDTMQDDGTLNLVVRGSDLLGVAVAYGSGDTTGLRGRVSGANITVWLEEGSESQPVASGTFSSDRSSAQGSIAAADGNTGTWQAGACN